MGEWTFSLAPWVILDGSYPDFEDGQRAQFAVEAVPVEPLALGPGPAAVAADPLGADRYEIEAEVVVVTEGGWALDFGLAAYEHGEPPPGASPGAAVRGVVELGVDPWFYLEELAGEDTFPALIHTWDVIGITRETARLVDRGDGVLVADPASRRSRRVAATDAAADAGEPVRYLLHCRRLDTPPRRRSATALRASAD
jgi:hypothetical protein